MIRYNTLNVKLSMSKFTWEMKWTNTSLRFKTGVKSISADM